MYEGRRSAITDLVTTERVLWLYDNGFLSTNQLEVDFGIVHVLLLCCFHAPFLMSVSLPLFTNHSVFLQYVITYYRVYVQVYKSPEIPAIHGARKCVTIITKLIGYRFMVVVVQLW
jgi:hypothetical protein